MVLRVKTTGIAQFRKKKEGKEEPKMSDLVKYLPLDIGISY